MKHRYLVFIPVDVERAYPVLADSEQNAIAGAIRRHAMPIRSHRPIRVQAPDGMTTGTAVYFTQEDKAELRKHRTPRLEKKGQ